MIRRRRVWLLSVFAGLVLVWLNNTSNFSSASGRPVFIAHRGLAQEMYPEHEDYTACVARIHAPTHTFIENTIPSIEAAFKLGATFVEIDVRLTADGQFAVFHDDVLNCKTEAKGLVSDHSMAELRSLDVGFGYVTEDGSHPLRGHGIGMMPSLAEVLERFPTQGFVIDAKDNLGPETERLVRIVEAHEQNDAGGSLIFGGERTTRAIRRIAPSLRAVSRESARRCVRDYMIVGWTGYIPGTCRHTVTGMYVDYAWLLWGWPHRFVERMAGVGTMVVLTHPYQTESIHDVPETAEYARMIPAGYSGAVITNRIDKIREWIK